MLPRVLEPEAMDTVADALEYDTMDHSAVNDVFVRDLLAAAPAPADVLDLGTGTAQIPIVLCQRTETCRVMAIDLAVSMLDLARYRVEVAGLVDRIQLAQVDAKELPFRDVAFDVVMSNSIVHHVAEPLRVLSEATRVATPNGLLFFRDLVRPESAERVDELVRTYAADANERQRALFAASFHAALTLDEIRDLVATLGFPRESVQMSSDRHWTWVARRPG